MTVRSVRHPNKHIRQAVEEAVRAGWRLEKAGRSGHVWGNLKCPAAVRGGCFRRVYGTPRNPEAHADLIRAAVAACPH